MSWHVDVASADRYVARRLDPNGSASVEAHLVSCAACRERVGAAVDSDVLEAVWRGVTDAVDQPALGWLEHTLSRLGCSDANARMVSATTRARWSYLLAVGVSIALAISASQSSYERLFAMFLIAAPLGPLAATAGAFGRWSDPAAELLSTVPTSSLRILLVRTAAAVVPALALTAISLPWIADRGWLAVAWLLPSLALALGAVALSSWTSIERAALGLGVVWVGAPMVLRLRVPELLETFSGPVQIASLGAVAVAVAVTVLRRTEFEWSEG